MREDLKNIRLVCGGCAPKPQKAYADMPKEFFVGKYVKLGFEGERPDTGEALREHMWVRVDEVAPESSGVELLGTLLNDPILLMVYRCDDGVGFDRSEIEVCDADGGRTNH